ncbi:hypothetical protein AJ80_06812 [Polytolypa hystricis UAMH7299]|uniref:CCAAT-binding factor domain-containing protein n=1 Tax=Polytolypa hystricis (strain UAMH7299) TaxID=1447883 RepID=A0A2B7XU77_POLH7|nr:hypothetical protein AJ80_06812 [Polytolypa hystricis UAMH7299]
MAKSKSKGRRSSTSDPSLAEPTEQFSTEPAAAVDLFPDFSESALASLTKNIEQRLHGKGESKPRAEKAPKETPKKSTGSDSKVATPKSEKTKKGKKRDRNGDVIPVKDNAKESASSKLDNGDSGDALEQEIYAIGGSKEDYDLLAGVESGSEMEGSNEVSEKHKDDTLRKDLEKLMGGGSVNNIPKREVPETKQNLPQAPKPAKQQPKQQPKEIAKTKPAKEEKPAQKEVAKTKPAKEDKPAQKEVAKTKPAKEEKPAQKEVQKKIVSGLAIPLRPDWYATPLPEIRLESKQYTISNWVMDRIRNHAMSLLEAENKSYAAAQQSSSSSSQKFYSTILSSGTLSDKISALTLAVQESPIHNVKGLESLIALAKKRSRAQAVEVLRSLKDLFAQGTLLPSDRRLKALANQPGLAAAFGNSKPNWTKEDPLPGGLEKSHLILWAFEDFIKEQYFEVLKILEVWCNDEIEFSRSRAVSYVYELLKEKPEQESNLLRLLVNKLGDPNKKIASRASYLLLQLEQTHPLMKPTIISAVESDIIFRPGQNMHAKYYAIITLNQTVLSSAEEKVAIKLLDIYFSLFVSLLKHSKDAKPQVEPTKQKKKRRNSGHDDTKGQAHDDQLREKLVSGLLAGVNRAYPFTNSDIERLSKHIDTLFRITHSSNFNTSIQALMLIQQLSTSHQVATDRFYKTLYESLLDPRITTSSKQSMYLNILYKALKADLNVKRVKAFVKRLIQILGLHHPSFVCGVLYLIRELENTFSSLSALIDEPEDHDSDDEEVFRDVPEEGDEPTPTPQVPDRQRQKNESYDSRKRDPEHSNADKSCLWELLPYLSHFHPSVAVNATNLLNHDPMSGKPDLTIHTITHFLDRFVYRNPKSAPSLRGSSIMQPLAGGDASGLLVTGKGARTTAPINSEAFWKKKTDEIAAEDAFFHDYFNRMGKEKVHKQKSKKKGATEDEDESEAEAEIWKALVESRPELEGGDASGDDFDVDDLDSAMGEEDEDLDDLAEAMDEDEDEGGVIFNDESEEEEAGTAAARASEGEEDEEAFDMDISDEDAFFGSDDEVPSDFGEGMEAKVPTEPEVEGNVSKRAKRRKIRNLPTFASVDDYAALLGDDDEGM